ncbi:hypothetical protein TIFTF001_031873 [Ficus carica]|uniref:Uncharacterized protein n=1 Tax=Ficus carica TaxID=3494 RepID=A0AA88J1N3_FICCA|nr:hypothetical protein TIFTF001_031873 [Ficus carica]
MTTRRETSSCCSWKRGGLHLKKGKRKLKLPSMRNPKANVESTTVKQLWQLQRIINPSCNEIMNPEMLFEKTANQIFLLEAKDAPKDKGM